MLLVYLYAVFASACSSLSPGWPLVKIVLVTNELYHVCIAVIRARTITHHCAKLPTQTFFRSAAEPLYKGHSE